jgi:hypothetical protein
VKWTRAVHHLTELAGKCAELAGSPIYPLRVVQLWAVGDILGPARDLDVLTVALAVDLPEVPWRSEPPGAEHWSNATRLSRNPIEPLWRSANAPVWNHEIERPALLWDATGGVAEESFAAIEAGRGEEVRLPAPSAEECRQRLADELAISLRALHDHTRTYAERRWSPGKLTPVSDALYRASAGYLDLLDAQRTVRRG